MFLANVEEMRWNPILSLWNCLGLGRVFSPIIKSNIPVLGPILVLLASTIWFTVTFFQIPVPAKLTLHIGKPVQYDMSTDSIDDVSSIASLRQRSPRRTIFFVCVKVVERAHDHLQALIDREQPKGKSYANAVKQRIQCLVSYWSKVFAHLDGQA